MNGPHPASLPPGDRLGQLLDAAGLPALSPEQTRQFEAYLALLLRWNARVNLTAIRDAEGILSRHFVESIACACALPQGITTLFDLGSGAGFPGLPIAICRPEIAVTLGESQGKKAAFLQEAVRTLGVAVKVHAGRAEDLRQQFDCVTLRAVDRMELAVRMATGLVRTGGWLAPMITRQDSEAVRAAAGADFAWSESVPLPGSDERILALATRRDT
ncbi:MAG: 16S rRNA (guanine(527)-N(7))-methyltransferase RsmG [Terracidiphilus sp.]